MDKNNQQMQQVQKLLASNEGQQLMKLLSGDGGKAMRAAAKALQQGDQQTAQETVAPLLKSREAQDLMQALNRAMGNGRS